jgi:signal peptidase I
MKKYIILLTTIFSLAVMLPAADFSLSAGGGGLLGYTFTRYALEGGNVKSTQSMDRLNYGGGLFFDAVYGEFSVMFQGANNSYAEKMDYGVTSLANSAGRGYEASLGFSLLGKYPFRINEKISWFPLLGVEYQTALIERRQPDDGDIMYNRAKGYLIEDRDKNGKPYPLSAWNSWWIDIGAGLDYNLTGPLFLRSELLFGFRLRTDYETGALEVVQNPPVNAKDPRLAGLTGGPALKISIGYRF